MKKHNETKLFAFKLSEKVQNTTTETQWKARDGVSTAGCTGMWQRGPGTRHGEDTGMYC